MPLVGIELCPGRGKNKTSVPKNYWGNTSHNGIIYRFINREDLHVNDKLEKLMAGGSVVTEIEENLTYDTIRSTEKNLWSLLYLTGYLTKAGAEASPGVGRVALKIPNEEVKTVFEKTIMEWFNNSMQTEDRRELFRAFGSCN